MPSHLAMQFVERVKNEMHQRRIPTITGGGQNMMDSSYNPLSINEDYFFPQGQDGRGSSVETLQGGANLGEIDDLKYFNNKMARGLRVPSSYLPTGPDDSDRALSDGKVGTALIQEYRFNQYCERLQALIAQKLDDEFKMFLKWRGFNIDSGLFSIGFNAPQNFASYRQAEMDGVRINTFGSIVALPFISKRYALKRFLGLKQEEIAENQEMWEEENLDKTKPISASAELRSAGITAGGMGGDMDSLGQSDPGTPEMQGADETGGAGNAAMAPSAGSAGGGGSGAPQGPM
jgi:hypothetical protein